MSGAVPPLHQCAFMAWCLVKRSTGTTLPSPLPSPINYSYYEQAFSLLRVPTTLLRTTRSPAKPDAGEPLGHPDPRPKDKLGPAVSCKVWSHKWKNHIPHCAVLHCDQHIKFKNFVNWTGLCEVSEYTLFYVRNSRAYGDPGCSSRISQHSGNRSMLDERCIMKNFRLSQRFNFRVDPVSGEWHRVDKRRSPRGTCAMHETSWP
jgi:hypothetical protein